MESETSSSTRNPNFHEATLGRGTMHTKLFTTTSIPNEEEIEGFKTGTIYPNPTPGNFTIQDLSTTVDRNFRVLTISGKQVAEGELSPNGDGTLPTELPPGPYFIKTNSGLIIKIVKASY